MSQYIVGFCLCLDAFHLFFILKNSTVLNNYKHTHNMMQPPLCFKIWRVVFSNVFCWICPKHKTLYLDQTVNWFATFLQYYFSALLQTGCMFWNIYILHSVN